jgi:5-formyltetrahydrofolate cyclo-ligase
MTDLYKKTIRTTLKQVRANTSATFQTRSSHRICKKIRTMEPYRHAKRLGLYHAMNGEVDLTTIWNSAPLHGKQCYFPVLNQDLSLTFLPATPATPFKPNRFGIDEPDVSLDMAIAPEELDLVIVPLVAFDRACMRLGMGAGSYDRTFASPKRGLLLGVAYQFQRINFINPESWDVPLDVVVTEQEIYSRKT